MDTTKPKLPKQRTTVFDPHHFVAGHISGMMAIVASMPMDVVKTKAQIEPEPLWRIARKTISHQGFRGLYTGMSSPLIGYGFVSAIWFGVNFNALSYLQPDEQDTKISFKNGMIAGGLAGLAGTFVISPMERLKVYTQCNANMKGGMNALKDLVRSQGVRDGLFRGFHVTAAREVSQVSVHFSSYYLINNLVRGHYYDGRKPVWLPLVSGAVAGCLSWVFTMPLDIVKTKLTAQKQNEGHGVRRVLSNLVREGGIRRLWAGTGAAFLRCIPLHATLFFMYDNTYEFLRKRF
jgi:solute carrier family 25 (mitochondrial carnitine/acylcarnitine transporter), member 20/29